MACKTKRIKSTKICGADLKKRVAIYTRSLLPSNNSISQQYAFVLVKTVWGAIETVTGEITFKGVASLEATTHYFYIRYREDITSENYIQYKGNWYNILKVENINEDNKYLKLYASIMGSVDKGAVNW